MILERIRRLRTTAVLMLGVLLVTTACAKQQTQPQSEPASNHETSPPAGQAPETQEPLLAKKYSKVLVDDFTIPPDLAKDYPDAVRECQAGLIAALQEMKTFQQVGSLKAGLAQKAGALIVRAKVTDLRIVSTGARIWAGWMAGNSYMNIDVQLLDAATQAVVRQKTLTNSNNAWAASWAWGSSDHSMPTDMGMVIAEYLRAITPAK